MHYYRKFVDTNGRTLMVVRLRTQMEASNTEFVARERCRQERETGQPVLIEPATREEWDEWFEKMETRWIDSWGEAND